VGRVRRSPVRQTGPTSAKTSIGARLRDRTRRRQYKSVD
jgi:hypothetical protein